MEIGVMMGAGGEGQTLEDLVDVARGVEAAGLDTVWMANIFSFDAINALSLIGSKTSTLKMGTAVVPTYPRHPTAMAQQALTAAAATGNRFTLGIGLSHQIVIEGMLGMSYAQPAKHMQEYLSVLVPLLNKEMVNHAGENYTVRNTQLDVARCQSSIGGRGGARPTHAEDRRRTRRRHQYLDGGTAHHGNPHRQEYQCRRRGSRKARSASGCWRTGGSHHEAGRIARTDREESRHLWSTTELSSHA